VACFQTSLPSCAFLRFMAYCTPMAAAASMSNFFTGFSSLRHGPEPGLNDFAGWA
jgi:hypothetical protein